VTNHSSHLPSDAELRLQLRGLSKEREVGRDLWPGIAAGIQNIPGKKKNRLWPGLAMAASLALVVVLALPLFTSHQSGDGSRVEAQVVRSEVRAMDVEYQAALKEFSSAKVAPEVKAQLQLLDNSARQLHQALNQSPQSTFLIPMLRRTYLQRLQLTQRALATNLV